MDKDYMVEKLLEGLQTDGAHHKQYTLEVVLIKLVGLVEFEKLKAKHQWQDGIPG